jgi:hypothetical protein
MGNTSLVYQWNATKLMTNCAFAIVKIRYSQSANLTSLQTTRFQVTNSRYKPGDCLQDYLTSSRYGAAIPTANIDTTSLTALNTYCNGTFTYTTYGGSSSTQTRFRFDGVLDTQETIMTNLQYMATNCDCLLRFNEITNTWGVIVQSPTYTVAMALDDSNIVGAINVTPLDIASSFNIAEVKFPDSTAQDSFNTATFNLAVLNPSLLYPNEPVNKQAISLPLVASATDNWLCWFAIRSRRYCQHHKHQLWLVCQIISCATRHRKLWRRRHYYSDFVGDGIQQHSV